MRESPANLLLDRDFEYRLNRMEFAAKADAPAEANYYEHRLAVFQYVANLQRENERLKRFEGEVDVARTRLSNSRITPERFREMLKPEVTRREEEQ